MKISYNRLQEYFNAKLPDPKTLSELFTVHTFEVEEIENKGVDTVFEFKVLPDRAHYLLSHRGVAREASLLTGLPLKLELNENNLEGVRGEIEVKISSFFCKRYIAVLMENIKTEESPVWLKNFLETLGQKSINNLVDMANYVMLDIGQPMHIFDADKIEGDIEVRNAREGENIILLTGEEKSLNSDDVIVADDKGALAIAGIKGGKRAEVDFQTKRILIESANFDPVAVRRTSNRLNLRNDSSKRFENEITPIMALEGMNKLTGMIKGELPQVILLSKKDVYQNPARSWRVSVSIGYISSLLGIEISEDRVGSILKRMGCIVESENGHLVITPPMDRLDIARPEDVADEVGRVIGYEKIPSKLPQELESRPLPDKVFFYAEKIKDILVERGYSETMLYSLVSKGFYEISYPLAKDKSFLRESILPKLSEALILNGRNADLLSLETIRLFEIGKVFLEKGEKTALAMGVFMTRKKKGITSENLLKEDIEEIERSFGIPFKYKISVGEFGAMAEFDFDELVSKIFDQGSISDLNFKSLPQYKKYNKFSQYPFVVRDMAVFVPADTTSDRVSEIITGTAGELLLNLRLFDVFKKDFNGQEKISYAFRLVFQSQEKTLTDEEVNEIVDGITNTLNSFKGFEVR